MASHHFCFWLWPGSRCHSASAASASSAAAGLTSYQGGHQSGGIHGYSTSTPYSHAHTHTSKHTGHTGQQIPTPSPTMQHTLWTVMRRVCLSRSVTSKSCISSSPHSGFNVFFTTGLWRLSEPNATTAFTQGLPFCACVNK